MQKIIKKIKDKNLYLSLLITLVFFGIFIRMEYATDTYSVLASYPKEIFNHFMESGRFVTALWWGAVNVLNLGDYLIYLSSFILAIICITLAIYNLYLVISKKIENSALSLILSTITIINPFSIELFLFIEKGIFGLGILLSILAFSRFVKYLEGDKKSLIFIFIYMLIATFCYQGVIGLFIAISAVYVIVYNKNIKDFIKNNIIILLGYGIPAIINLITVKFIYGNSRVTGEVVLQESIQKILQGSKEMIASYNILPKYTLVIAILALTLFYIVSILISKKDSIKKKALNILGLAYIFIAILGISIVPQIMQSTESIWFVPRSTYPFATIMGLVSIYALITTEKNNIKYIIIGIISVSILAMQLYSFNKIEIDHYNLNYMDKINSLSIGKEIQAYEQETGNKVTKICIYNDQNISYTYPYIWAKKDTNITGFYPDWSIIKMINYYNNINLTQGEINLEIEESFKEKDWDNYSDEQIIFIGDTIHYCKF